ncbi:helix-turn-helix domain-containing protein [Rhodococcus hoagii]|nr:helix-turn-helix domain-containing protein [Prescottella equi]
MTLQTRRARESGGLGVTQLAEILDMDKSQVSRSLKVLTEYGMVDRDPKTRAFRLGWRIFNMAQVSGDQRLLECAGGVLDGLLNRLDESVYLSVRSGYDALTVAERTANHSIQAMPAHWSLYSTSVGRVLLTDKTSAEIREMYSGQKLRSARVDGVGSVDDLVEAVTRAREDGHSIVVDEFEGTRGRRRTRARLSRRSRRLARGLGTDVPSGAEDRPRGHRPEGGRTGTRGPPLAAERRAILARAGSMTGRAHVAVTQLAPRLLDSRPTRT